MSGHSKWATIKHQKGAKDIKRGQIFTKIVRLIAIAAREGGGNLESNFKLRLALDKARQVNMPQATMEKAIRRGTGEDSEGQIEEVIYEAVGTDGLAILIKTATDNKNRTLAEIKNILGQHRAKLATSGSLAWQFAQKGILDLGAINLNEEQELAIIEAGAEDIQKVREETFVYTHPQDLQKVKENLDQAKISVQSADLGFIPKNTIKIEAPKVESLLNALGAHDDVQEIYTNLEVVGN